MPQKSVNSPVKRARPYAHSGMRAVSESEFKKYVPMVQKIVPCYTVFERRQDREVWQHKAGSGKGEGDLFAECQRMANTDFFYYYVDTALVLEFITG